MGWRHLLGPLDRLRGSRLTLVTLDELLHGLKGDGLRDRYPGGKWLALSRIESIHVLGVTVLIGCVGLLELRLIGPRIAQSLGEPRAQGRAAGDLGRVRRCGDQRLLSVRFERTHLSLRIPSFWAKSCSWLERASMRSAFIPSWNGPSRSGTRQRAPLPARLSGIFSLVMWRSGSSSVGDGSASPSCLLLRELLSMKAFRYYPHLAAFFALVCRCPGPLGAPATPTGPSQLVGPRPVAGLGWPVGARSAVIPNTPSVKVILSGIRLRRSRSRRSLPRTRPAIP